ncbi:redoxin domain-containing protein [Kineococcus terrestris]|uniref:redoxin domain-containing protein n=1 Tax=Kineococcus terrestris TaxID=2044856 RepID=UPI0034DB3351
MAGGVPVRDQFGALLRPGELWEDGPALLVLVPGAFSTHCTAELGTLVGAATRFEAAGVQLAVLSCDPVPVLRAWGEEHGARFPLLSDFWPHGSACRALGAFDDELGVARRTSLLVVDGRARWVLHGERGSARAVGEHLDAVRDALAGGARG